ncbi:Coq4 family protein [Chamaesiphon sp. VAR_48_metabat_403]|uniref:Coq4 family protein n=1 Tax=Chamaesiphon sp. VAR_48_metabat_403 TaxID=2964700 RepID=UPI00286E9281|nr:Coq4 family protein [Chamaesiphon sp. VAR_48_metabat_403]
MLITLEKPDTWQQSMLSSMVAITQAKDGDFTEIDRLLEISGDPQSLALTIEYLSQFPHSQRALAHHQPLAAIDLAALHQLPVDTLGYHYADYMFSHQLQHLVAKPATSAAEFIDTHIRETHDIWHVVTGSPISMLGEIQVQAFCIAQLQLSRFWMALLTKNLLKASIYNIEAADGYMTALTTGWTMGKAAQPLFGIDWVSMWEVPLAQVRVSLGIVVA